MMVRSSKRLEKKLRAYRSKKHFPFSRWLYRYGSRRRCTLREVNTQTAIMHLSACSLSASFTHHLSVVRLSMRISPPTAAPPITARRPPLVSAICRCTTRNWGDIKCTRRRALDAFSASWSPFRGAHSKIESFMLQTINLGVEVLDSDGGQLNCPYVSSFQFLYQRTIGHTGNLVDWIYCKRVNNRNAVWNIRTYLQLYLDNKCTTS